VLASHLARQFGLRSTKYFFAKCDNVKGVISKDYKKENQEEIIPRDFLINYYKHNDNKGYITQHDSLNNIEFITKALKHGVEIGEIKKRDAQSITKKLLKTAMFDIAIQNPDRHFLNWGLLKSDKQYKYIPIFDSERCFNLFLGVKTIQNWFKDYEINPTQKNLQKAKNRIKEINDICNPCLSILPEEDKHFEDGKHYLESLKEYKQAFPNYFNKQLNNLFNFYKKYKKKGYYKKLLNITESKYKFIQYKKIFYSVVILSMVTIYFIGSVYSQYVETVNTVTERHPFHISYIQTVPMILNKGQFE
jgi:rRNA maturation endonuclease Nob1